MSAPIDAVVTHHRDGFRSGVARFNELLAERLAVPLLGLSDPRAGEATHPLLSFKITEMGAADRAALDALAQKLAERADLLLHAWGDSDFEVAIATRAGRVYGANEEIRTQLSTHVAEPGRLWAPSLLSDCREFDDAEISIFSFGMAHKIRTERFRQLRELLEDCGRSYTLYVSSANHETATMQEAQSVYEDMHALFPERLYFLGNLSDVAVYNQLRRTTFFASFFPDGVRANNTSVNAAMDQGAVVITNLDEHSPTQLVHMENVLDIDRCQVLPIEPAELERIGAAARATGVSHGWNRLVEALGDPSHLAASDRVT